MHLARLRLEIKEQAVLHDLKTCYLPNGHLHAVLIEALAPLAFRLDAGRWIWGTNWLRQAVIARRSVGIVHNSRNERCPVFLGGHRAVL